MFKTTDRYYRIKIEYINDEIPHNLIAEDDILIRTSREGAFTVNGKLVNICVYVDELGQVAGMKSHTFGKNIQSQIRLESIPRITGDAHIMNNNKIVDCV